MFPIVFVRLAEHVAAARCTLQPLSGYLPERNLVIHRILWHVLVCATAFLLFPTSSGAQSPATALEPLSSFDTLWSRVRNGDVVYVTDDRAQTTTGIFANASGSTLSMLVDGQMRDTALGDIRLIARRGDPVRNGVLIGVGVGAGVSALTFVGCENADCALLPVIVVYGALYGAGIGALVDFLIVGRTTVYRASGVKRVSFMPLVGRGRQGLSVVFALPHAMR